MKVERLFTSNWSLIQDINSPTDSVIGRDFQELSAEEQERQREEWKAELKKTEEEILTLKQVLTAKERHAAGEEIIDNRTVTASQLSTADIWSWYSVE